MGKEIEKAKPEEGRPITPEENLLGSARTTVEGYLFEVVSRLQDLSEQEVLNTKSELDDARSKSSDAQSALSAASDRDRLAAGDFDPVLLRQLAISSQQADEEKQEAERVQLPIYQKRNAEVEINFPDIKQRIVDMLISTGGTELATPFREVLTEGQEEEGVLPEENILGIPEGAVHLLTRAVVEGPDKPDDLVVEPAQLIDKDGEEEQFEILMEYQNWGEVVGEDYANNQSFVTNLRSSVSSNNARAV